MKSSRTTGSSKPFFLSFVFLNVVVYPLSSRSFLLSIILTGALVIPVKADNEESFKPNIRPTYHVPRLESTIEIDGQLDDTGWIGVPRATNFSEQFPDNGEKPPVETEVLLTYDDSHLYIAFICYDSDAGSIRSSLTDRDRIWSDDYMGFILDTYGDGAWAYEIFVNPLGIQGDGRQVTSAGEDIGFDLIFESEGVVTDSCYQVEIALPFASLRFPDKPKQEWKATFWRTRPRESRATSSWAFTDDDVNCWLCEFGTLTGIENVKPGSSFELLPSVIGFQSGEIRDTDDRNSGIENKDVDGEVSMGLRYDISTGTSIEATLNPDFSQVESDVTQIDVNETFALFYPEKRPFFQEGGDLFQTFIDAVYTRAINNPTVAAKLIGRKGSINIAYMSAHDKDSPIIIPLEERSGFVAGGESYSNILRFKQTFGGSSNIGALLTDRRFEGGGNNTVFGVDGNLRFREKYRLEAQVVGSYSEEPDDSSLTADIEQIYFDGGKHTVSYDGESFGGHALYTGFERRGRTWNFQCDYREESPTFRADNGFITRNDHREAEFWTGLNFYPESKIIDKIEPGFVYGRVWNTRSKYKDSWLVSYVSLLLKAQTWVNFEHIYTREVFREVALPGRNIFEFNVSSDFSEPVQAGFFISVGSLIARNEDPPVLGDGLNYTAWVDVKLLPNVKIQQSYRFSQLKRQDTGEELFSGYIYRSRINYQFTRELLLRLIIQYNEFSQRLDLEPLLSYELNPFTIFYIGSTYDYRDVDESDNLTLASRQFFMKFQYLFRM